MLTYKEYEKSVFEWLLAKHQQDPDFNFTLRHSASKGAETDYFIGTSKSRYFATSFWTLKVNFPGSSGECISLVFLQSRNGYSYYFELTQTNSPEDEQNNSALLLLKYLKEPLENEFGFKRPFIEGNKMFNMILNPKDIIYEDLDIMLNDIDSQLDTFIKIVDEHLFKIKTLNESFIGHRVTPQEFELRLNKMYDRFDKHTGVAPLTREEEPVKAKVIDKFIRNTKPLNQILYGPPGTGKTYRTVLEAAQIVTGLTEMNYDGALEVFNSRLGNQIEFITFHQNYSYEDFIQGLRPDVNSSDGLSFEKQDGIFKRIADRALNNLLSVTNPTESKLDFEFAFQKLIAPLLDGDSYDLEVKMKMTSYYITLVTDKTIFFKKNKGDSEHSLSVKTLKRMYESGSNEIILGGLQPYYNPLLNQLLQIGNIGKAETEIENFVLIIDEINRANISRVFGELITLLEEDKRSHGDIPMSVTLPSGDTFIVPSNLYIIGTMNTADKSISLLDIALRRRFEFIPMYPEYEGLTQTVNDAEKLKIINNAIVESGKGYDFTIGHAYFMTRNYTLADTINNKVIPLLLEYYMNDVREVIRILAAAGIIVSNWPLRMVLT